MNQDLGNLSMYLVGEYEARKQFNSAYSQRAFARDLGLSSTTMCDFLHGKRNLNLKNVNNVFKYLRKKKFICCSWCKKSIKHSSLMIGGPDHQFICKNCVDTCNEIIKNGKTINVISR